MTETICATVFSLKIHSISFNTAKYYSAILTCSAHLTFDGSHMQWTTGSGINSSITLVMDTYSSEINCTVILDAFSISSTVNAVKCKYHTHVLIMIVDISESTVGRLSM